MHSPESDPRGVETRPPSFFSLAFAVGLSVFQWGSNPHNPPPIFTPPTIRHAKSRQFSSTKSAKTAR